MRHQLFLMALAVLPALAQAEDSKLSALKRHNTNLGMHVDTCILGARTAFVQLRSGGPATEATEVERCVASGKEDAKQANAELKVAFKGKRAPEELTEWRLEWMATFDAAVLQTGDTEGAYMRRVQEARAKVVRATNKFEITLE